MFIVISVPDPKCTGRIYTLLVAAAILFMPSLLTGQELIHTFSDEIPKRHSSLTVVAADEDHFYIAGRSSAQCGPRHFVACLNKDGAEIWSTLDQEVKMGRIDRLHVVEGSLFVGATFDVESYSQTPGRAVLYKVDPATGAILWSRVVGNDGDLGHAAQILTYTDEQLIYYTRSSDLLTNRIQFYDVQSGELRSSADLNNASYNTGVNIAADSRGDFYFNFTDGIVKLDGASANLSEALWEFRIADVELDGDLADMFVTANDRLYCLTNLGEVLELDTETSALLHQFNFTNLNEIVYITDKIAEGDKLYLAWQTAANDGDSLNASKLDLGKGRLEWRSRTGFAAQAVMTHSLVISGENSLLLCGDLYDFDPERKFIGIAKLDAESGMIDTQFTIESDNRLLTSTLAKSGSDVRLFNNHIEEVSFSIFSHGESRRLNADGAPESDTKTYTGRAVFPSAVLQMINTEEQIIQLRQVGASLAVVWLDKELNMLHSTLLPQSNNFASGVRMEVNSLGQVAVFAGLKWWGVPGEERSAPGYKLGPVSSSFDIHLLNSSGEVLQSFFEQGDSGGYWLRDIACDGINFYMMWNGIDRVQMIKLSAEGLSSRALSVNRAGGQVYTRGFIVYGNRVFFAGAVKDQRGRLWEINTAEFNLELLLEWPECEGVATTAVNDNRATLACRYQGRAVIVHIDLESAEILWRQNMEQDDQTRYLLAHEQKLYTLGDKLDVDSDCLAFSIGRIDINSGEFDWIKLRPCEGGPYPHVFFADMKDDEIAVGGKLHHNPHDGRAHFVVIRLDLEGRERDFHVIDYPDSVPAPISEFDPGPVTYSLDGSLLYAVQQRFDGNCYLSAAVYRLDPVISAVGDLQTRSEQLTLVPNPVEAASRLVFNGIAGSEYTVEVRDLLGRKVLSRRIALEHPLSGVPLSLTHLPCGTYTVSVVGAGRQWQGVFVKQ